MRSVREFWRTSSAGWKARTDRSDALEKRRALLAAWANYVEGGTATAHVIPMASASK